MNEQIKELIYCSMIGVALLAWGTYGIVNKNKINNRANYILSVAQVLGAIMAFIFVIMYTIFKLK